MTVKDAIDAWLTVNGKRDPRPMLDEYFSSYTDRVDVDKNEIAIWCDENLGNENWYRAFNKYWFSTQSDLTMFRLAWQGNS